MPGNSSEPIAIDWKGGVFNMPTTQGICGSEMYGTWYRITFMVESGLDIPPGITHRFPDAECS